VTRYDPVRLDGLVLLEGLALLQTCTANVLRLQHRVPAGRFKDGS